MRISESMGGRKARPHRSGRARIAATGSFSMGPVLDLRYELSRTVTSRSAVVVKNMPTAANLTMTDGRPRRNRRNRSQPLVRSDHSPGCAVLARLGVGPVGWFRGVQNALLGQRPDLGPPRTRRPKSDVRWAGPGRTRRCVDPYSEARAGPHAVRRLRRTAPSPPTRVPPSRATTPFSKHAAHCALTGL